MNKALRCAKHSKASYGAGAFSDGEFPRLPDESDAAYSQRATVAAIQHFVGTDVAPSDVIECCSGSTVYDVAHYIALDRSAGAVVLAFRGTAGVEDAFTDLAAEDTGYALAISPETTLTGLAHIGIAASARAKFVALGSAVERAVTTMFGCNSGENNNGGRKPFVLVTGHSLGGGVASLVALEIAARHPEWDVEAYTFGSAASLSENVSQSDFARKVVRAFVMRDDVVPRMSLAALEWLKCLAKYVADYANDESTSSATMKAGAGGGTSPQNAPSPPPLQQQQQQQQQKTFFESAVEWAAKKTIGGTNVDMNAAVEAARKEFAARNPAGPKFLYPAGRIFWVKPSPPRPPARPLTASAPAEECAPPLPPKPRKGGDSEVPPPLPPKSGTAAAGGKPQNELVKSDSGGEKEVDLFKFGMDICETPGIKWLEEIPLTDTFITDHYMKNYLSAMNNF